MVATKKYLTNIHLIGDEKKEAAIANILGDREIDSVENAYEALAKKGISAAWIKHIETYEIRI